jgi:hypothetical protein
MLRCEKTVCPRATHWSGKCFLCLPVFLPGLSRRSAAAVPAGHRDTGEPSFREGGIDWPAIRAVSFAFPKGGDWREVERHVAAAMAAA